MFLLPMKLSLAPLFAMFCTLLLLPNSLKFPTQINAIETKTKIYANQQILVQGEHHPRRLPPRSHAIQKLHRNVKPRPDYLPPIDYGSDHPFESHSNKKARSLHQKKTTIINSENIPRNTNDNENTRVEDLFKDIRIRFEYTNLSIRGPQDEIRVRTLKSEILPKIGLFYKNLLSVIPVEGNIPVSEDECFGYVRVPKDFSTRGVANVDLVIFVAGFENVGGSQLCGGESGILAAASPCSLDQFDRPITGFINFCLDEIKISPAGKIFESDKQNLISVGTHEFAHVLGINGESWKFFRHPRTGIPLTPRPFEPQTFTCVNGETENNIIVPSCHTLQQGVSANGMSYFEIVTPTVRQVARNQFGCQTLTGARLENQPTNAHDCFGTHWDERYFYSETLSAFYAPEANYFSALTLALLEDSGWYRANYTNAQTSPFGHGAGCDFVEKPCIEKRKDTTLGAHVPYYGRGFFCDTLMQRSVTGDLEVGDYTCDPSHRWKAGCDLMERFYRLPRKGQYFQDSRIGVFFFESADYCPIAQVGTRDCQNPINNDRFGKNKPGEIFGPDSLCFDSQIPPHGKKIEDVEEHAITKTSLCLKSHCNPSTLALEVYVAGTTLICQFDFQNLGFIYRGQEIRFTCPRLLAACPDLFCPANCSGRGLCNYQGAFPECECFNPADTSKDCRNTPLMVPEDVKEHECSYASSFFLYTISNNGIAYSLIRWIGSMAGLTTFISVVMGLFRWG